MLKYTEFILESLILESNVIYSSKFKKILSILANKPILDPIAIKLLELENKDLDVISNYFDIDTKNDNVISFTPDKIATAMVAEQKGAVKFVGKKGGWLTNRYETNKDIFDVLGYAPIDNSPVYHPATTDIGRILGTYISEKSGKTFHYVRFQNGSEGVYNATKIESAEVDLTSAIFKKNRQEIRIGRGIRTILNAGGLKDYKDTDIEAFVASFKARIKIENDIYSRFFIVEGDALGFWYHRKNYKFPHAGAMGSSCQAPGRLDWLEIYITSPETVKLLILKPDDDATKIIGRALIWLLDDGRTMMDYIYYSNDAVNKIFSAYCKHMGWVSRNDLGYDRKNQVFSHVKPGRLKKYPSVDTMNNIDFNTGKVSNWSFPGSSMTHWNNDANGDGPYYAHPEFFIEY